MINRVIVSPIGDSSYDNLTASDIAFIEALKCAKRRAEVTQWRGILRRALLDIEPRVATFEIEYNAVGAPYLVGSDLHIGVSHSSQSVAVVVSEERCAVDIESTSRNFEYVADRYATPAEREIAPLPLIWAAKETLYKLSNSKGLDLLRDLRIIELTPTEVIGEVLDRKYTLGHFIQGDEVVVHTL